MNKQKSFTLIELLVVIVIIGILAGVIMISTSSSIDKANVVKSKVFEESVQNNLATNMVSRWKLDEESGTEAKDSWGTNNGTTISDIIFKSGNDCVTGGCYEFNGITSYVEILDSQEMRMTQGGTITAWIYPRSLGELNVGRIIDKSTATSGANGYIFYILGSPRLSINTHDGTTATSTSSSANTLILNQWNFVTVTLNNLGRHIYVNGVNVTSGSGDETGLPPDVAGAVRIGNRAGATDRTFDGYIDDVRIYNAALSSSQVKQNYIAGLDSLLSNGNISKEEYGQRLNELAVK